MLHLEAGHEASTFDAAGGRECVRKALFALKGAPVVEMSFGATSVGEVVEVADDGNLIHATAEIAHAETWRKVEAHVYKGARVTLGGSGISASQLVLADAPSVGDVIIRSAGPEPTEDTEVERAVRLARQAMNDLRRTADLAARPRSCVAAQVLRAAGVTHAAPAKTAGAGAHLVAKGEDAAGHVMRGRDELTAAEIDRHIASLPPTERAELLTRAALRQPMPIAEMRSARLGGRAND
ncbi:MAG: hypothetical protein JO303_07830 [Caulobacteraceae bacterium]|nr:hypothetical protein [Caulobacteraceae bacterium]